MGPQGRIHGGGFGFQPTPPPSEKNFFIFLGFSPKMCETNPPSPF